MGSPSSVPCRATCGCVTSRPGTIRAASSRASTMSRPDKHGATWSKLCKLALKLPGVTEGTSYGTPALHVQKRFLARLKEDGESVAIKIDFPDREVLLELDPAAFYLTDHYRPWPAVPFRLKEVRQDMLQRLLEQAWRVHPPHSLPARTTRVTARPRARPPG